MPASCYICGGPLLLRHTHNHCTIDVKPEVCCPRCTTQFHYPAELLEHARVHGDNPANLKWECYTCGRYFLCRNQYEKHMTRPHPPTPGAVSSDLSCNFCCKSFKNGLDLKAHIQVHFDDLKKERPYVCHECGKVRNNLAALNYHCRQHVNTNLFPCLYCPEVLTAPSELRSHMKLHLGHTGTYHCHLCDKQFMREVSYRLHLKIHCKNGDGVCMKCLVAFPTEELFDAHNRIHSQPYKCSSCSEQFDIMELLKTHVETDHCCTKVFVCGRCNLGLLSAEELEQHEDNHMQEDDTVAKQVRSKSHKNQELGQISINNNVQKGVPIPFLNMYCTCLICNPSQHRFIDPNFVGASLTFKKCKYNVTNTSFSPVDTRKCKSFFRSATINKINEALATLRAKKIPSSPGTMKTPPSPHVPEMAALSKMPELQTTFQNATVKKVKKRSAAAPVISEVGVTSLPKTTLTPTLIPYQNCEGSMVLPEAVPYPVSVAVAIPNDHSEQMIDPSKVVASYLEIDNSTIVPDVTEHTNVVHIKTEPQLHPPRNTPLLTLFCELLVQVLGQETVERLSYAIIANVRAFLQSFLPSVEVNTVEFTTEDTVWLFIQSMVRLFGEEKDELVDYALNGLDLRSLVQEMLRCMDFDNSNSEVKLELNNDV